MDDRNQTARAVVFLWDQKQQRVVCALRSRLAASGLTTLPRQSVASSPDVISRNPSGAMTQEAVNLLHALQAKTNILSLPEVCHDFFERAGCRVANVTAFGHHGDRISRRSTGAKCNRVHVIGIDHTWNYLLPTIFQSNPSAPASYGPGFLVLCTNSSHSQYYKIPSVCVAVTSGSESFVDRYNKEGRHFHGQPHRVCPDFAASCLTPSAICSKGSQCADIHVSIPTNGEMLLRCLNELAILEQADHVRRDIQHLGREMDLALRRVSNPGTAAQSALHILDLVLGGTPSHLASEEARYPRLGRNFIVRVYAPNFTNGVETDFPSEHILITSGALRYRNQMLGQRNDFSLSKEAISFYCGEFSGPNQFPVLHPHQNVQKIQHCAHFVNKGMCRNGQNCKFVHAVVKQPSPQQEVPHLPHQGTFVTQPDKGLTRPSQNVLQIQIDPNSSPIGAGSQRVVARVRKHPVSSF